MFDVDRCVEIGVYAVATDHAAKRLLVGSVGAIWIVTDAARLRGVGALDFRCRSATLSCVPGDLLGDVRQVGGVQVGIHGARLVLHGRNRKLFVGELRALVLGKALVDRAVDLLTHVPGEALPAFAACGGELLHPFLLQTRAQFGLAPSLLAVALLSLLELSVKGAVVLAVARRDEVGDAHIYADHRGRGFGLAGNLLVIRERQPPAVTAPVERHTGIDGFSREHPEVVGSQLDRDQQLLAECECADLEPVVKGRVLRRLEDGDVDIGLDADVRERRDVPFAPCWFFSLCSHESLRLLLVKVLQIIRIVLIRLFSIGAKGAGDTSGLLDGNPVPPLGKGGDKTSGAELVWLLVGAEEGDILLAERQVDLGEAIQGSKFASIHRFQPDVGHGFGDGLRYVLPPVVVFTLPHGSCSWLSFGLLRSASSIYSA